MTRLSRLDTYNYVITSLNFIHIVLILLTYLQYTCWYENYFVYTVLVNILIYMYSTQKPILIKKNYSQMRMLSN
jgi:hypothetical protein